MYLLKIGVKDTPFSEIFLEETVFGYRGNTQKMISLHYETSP